MNNNHWNKMYELAKQYYERNGSLIIKEPSKNGKLLDLRKWLIAQRRQYKLHTLAQEKIDLLNHIGMIWSLFDFQWSEFYDLATEYYRAYGHLLVPQRYKTACNKQLGQWISHQRNDYKLNKLSTERVNLLEKIGMVWDGTDAIWNAMFKIAQQYYNEHKNLTISSTRCIYRNVNLGSWILTQRTNYTNNSLTEIQIERLNKIGMEWVSTKSNDYIWDYNYNIVLKFYDKYKHLYIPTNYVSEEGIRIGVWLNDQKIKYEQNKISGQRKNKLDLLDKTWLEPSKSKSSFPEQAVLFYIKKHFPSADKKRTKEISEIDIYIPEIKVGIEYDGPTHINHVQKDINKTRKCKELGISLIRIRDCQCPIIDDESYKIILRNDTFEALDEGITKLLNHLNVSNFRINVKRDFVEILDNYVKSIDLNWYISFDKLKEYYREHGNINVPASYKTADGFALGKWLSSIRMSVNNPSQNSVRINSYKISLLNELGMDWSPSDTKWKKMYSYAETYYSENRNLLVPNQYLANGCIKLGVWIGMQRYSYKRKKLSQERIEALERIGMVWSVSDYEWEKNYEIAVKYYEENGNLLVPSNYLTYDCVHLGEWIGQQRNKYKNHSIEDWKIDLLNKIGMIWSLRKV